MGTKQANLGGQRLLLLLHSAQISQNAAGCISDRYKSLPEPALQLEFLDLQLELLEDFRVRLNQVKNNTHNILSGQYCAILNTAHFVADVLREWSELVVG